jgi:hypothetical protein
MHVKPLITAILIATMTLAGCHGSSDDARTQTSSHVPAPPIASTTTTSVTESSTSTLALSAAGPMANTQSTTAASSPSFIKEADGSEWTQGFGQGVIEYRLTGNKRLAFTISCDTNGSPVSASLSVDGKDVLSEPTSTTSNDAFDVIVDGRIFSTPFDTSFTANAGQNFSYFWDHFRTGKSIALMVGATTYPVPSTKLNTLLPPQPTRTFPASLKCSA